MSRTITEPLLTEDDNRYVMFPIKDNEIWDMYEETSSDSFWRAEEMDLSKDMTDWLSLKDEERTFIKMVLAFFAASDGIVLEKFGTQVYGRCSISRGSCVLWIPNRNGKHSLYQVKQIFKQIKVISKSVKI